MNRFFFFSLTRRLAVVAETWYQQGLGVDDHDRLGADPVHSVQGGQFLRLRIVESPWYSHVPEVHLRIKRFVCQWWNTQVRLLTKFDKVRRMVRISIPFFLDSAGKQKQISFYAVSKPVPLNRKPRLPDRALSFRVRVTRVYLVSDIAARNKFSSRWQYRGRKSAIRAGLLADKRFRRVSYLFFT